MISENRLLLDLHLIAHIPVVPVESHHGLLVEVR